MSGHNLGSENLTKTAQNDLLRASLTLKAFFDSGMTIFWRTLDSLMPILLLLPSLTRNELCHVLPLFRFLWTLINLHYSEHDRHLLASSRVNISACRILHTPRGIHTALVLLRAFLKARDSTINLFCRRVSTAKPQGLLSSPAADDSVTNEHGGSLAAWRQCRCPETCDQETDGRCRALLNAWRLFSTRIWTNCVQVRLEVADIPARDGRGLSSFRCR